MALHRRPCFEPQNRKPRLNVLRWPGLLVAFMRMTHHFLPFIKAPFLNLLFASTRTDESVAGVILDQVPRSATMTGVRLEAVQNVPLFIDWNKQEVQEVARLFNEHRFVKNEIVVKEG